MSTSQQYAEAWEGFWREASGTPGDAIWDADPSLTAAPHLELFAPHADPALPVVDLGCGNGTQTRYLATRFPRAVGVDISAAAVEHARRADTDGVAEFERLDLTDTEAVRALHARIGDANVYMRAVIHQSRPEDRPAVARAVAELTGARGRAFVAELTGAAKDVLAEAILRPDGPSPKGSLVMKHGLRPAEVAEDEVPSLLREAGLTILSEGAVTLAMTEFRADGERIVLPARWFVTGRAG
ncbi:class I SAM-dependent methyltransferase [Streptomyces olivoreticuli]|uniref:class I SAM-dependent methyltransferase n=1 Tax=Streptomyces olivoreticuli TaxID=68246 RepID=UPI000E2885AD|nr:class I SAM-dependent methyltransferase [Streptomyces olivoreticuli]